MWVYVGQTVQRDILDQDMVCSLDWFKRMHDQIAIAHLGKERE
jgi:hypothetical protein